MAASSTKSAEGRLSEGATGQSQDLSRLCLYGSILRLPTYAGFGIILADWYVMPKKSAPRRRSSGHDQVTPEYEEYLERYLNEGQGRPKLSPTQYDRLDDELLDLLAMQAESGRLSDEQLVRLRELEYLLLDPEA